MFILHRMNPNLKKYCILFLICLTLSGTTTLFAQDLSGASFGKSGQMSDQQIMQLWQQAQKSGMSESDAMKMLVRQGMSPSQVNTFKKRLVDLQGSSKSKTKSQNLILDTANFLRDTSWVFEVPEARKRSVYYGYDFFSNPNVSFEPNLNMGTPKNYVLGPGDELTVTLTGLNETNITNKLTREGNFDLEHGGIVALSGLTVEGATDKIRAKMKAVYPGLNSGITKLYVTLGNVRSITIHIIGEAQLPGQYNVSSLAGFINVLYKSGGPSQNGSLRKLELIRNNKVIQTIDFYTFLQTGLLPENIRLEDQDIIRFPVYEKRVSLNGEVKRPAIYELLEKETLADLLRYGGGLGDTAYTESAKVVQMGSQERRIRDVASTDFAFFILHNADSVFFDKLLPRYENRIYITGGIQRPGNYELTNGLTLSKLVQKAAGLREDAFVKNGFIKRRLPNGERDFKSFDITKVLSGSAPDISLIKEDSIFIISKDSLQDIPTVSVGGNVRAPGIFQYRQGMTLQDLIVMAGGFTNQAASHKVEISRLEKNKADTVANKLLDVIKVDMDSATGNNQASLITIKPQDYIFVPRLLNYVSLGSVKLRGEVLYAGDYELEKRDETVQEVIKRAGGISPYASMKDVQVFRNNTRVGTTLLANQEINGQKFLLLPDDSIYIPRNEPFVEVKGAVFNPQIISFESARFTAYISDAGGVTDKGNLRKSYIQYSNGISRKIHHFLFFRIYPTVKAGSKIIVPERVDSERRGLSIIELSAITGSLTALVSLMSILKL